DMFVPSDAQAIVAGAGTGAMSLTNMVVRIAVNPGYSMVVNQLSVGGNTLPEVFPNVPDGTKIFKLNPATATFSVNAFQAGQWSNPAEMVVPGEGVFILNPLPSLFTLTFSGQMVVPKSARQIRPGFQLVGGAFPRKGRISEVMDVAWQDGDTIYR